MLNLLILCSLIIYTAASPFLIPNLETVEAVTNYTNYRLPGNVIPSRYEINLDVPQQALEGTNTNFSGNVKITFNLTESTDTILIHSLVDFNTEDVILEGITETNPATIPETPSTITPYNDTDITFDNATEIATITFNTSLQINIHTHYVLTIRYHGNLETVGMHGFYRSEYNVNTVKEYLAVTQFEPTHARRAFPCFDEPQYKAVFVLSITHPTEFTARSNTPEVPSDVPLVQGLASTTFAATPVMSTYTLAFAISKFTFNEQIVDGLNPITHRVYSRESATQKRNFYLNYGVEIMNALDTWTDIPYSSMNISKIDQFYTIDGGAMENWGFVTYSENLMYDALHTSNELKQKIISTIAHAFSHMWFGNLVTTQWWDTVFLNKGLATYFEYFIMNQIPEISTYQMDQQFIIDIQKTALEADGLITSDSLTSEVWTPNQIQKKFSTISYNKGASILRMVENVVNPTSFQFSLQQYIRAYSSQSTTPDNLWGNFILPSQPNLSITFTEFIDSWTNTAGYPVINATTVNGSNIVLSQERFLYSGTDNSSIQWYVPIVYKYPNDSNALTNTVWLLPNDTATIENGSVDDNWVVLNQGASGYFRVNYDNTLRQRIISTLQTNHSVLSDIDRAQLIDDALNLARAGYIKYTEAMQMLDYLKNETSYYPWKAAIRGLDFLAARVGNESELGRGINTKILQLIANVSNDIYTTNWTEVDHVTGMKIGMIWTAACRAGQEPCIAESTRLFKNLIDGTSINPNIRKAVYCTALRHSTNASDWQYLWDRLIQTFEDPHESMYIRDSLGCTRNRTRLMFLLNESINNSSVIKIQDLLQLWSSIYSTSQLGLQVALEHFTSNHTDILQYHPGASSILSGIASFFSSTAEIEQLETFLNKQPNGTLVNEVASAALATARENLKWQQSVEGDLRTAFGPPEINNNQPDQPGGGSSITSTKMSLLLILASLFVIYQ